MPNPVTITEAQEKQLKGSARHLHDKFRGVFGLETIESLVFDSFGEMAARATITTWLVVGAERYAKERLEALAHSQSELEDKVPAVLFLCVHNAGRSQMALGWFNHLAGDRAIAWSGGSEPALEINPAAVEAMAEVGVDISKEFPKPWAKEFLGAADVVVTMGCGDSCPVVAGKRYEDWELEDPSGKTVEQVRPVRDEIGQRVTSLLDRLLVASHD